MSPWKSLVMTLRVNHREARFILRFVPANSRVPQQQLSCSYLHSNRMLLVTSNSALLIQGQQRHSQPCCNTALPLDITHRPCAHMCLSKAATRLCLKNPPALPVASVAPTQEFLMFQSEAASGHAPGVLHSLRLLYPSQAFCNLWLWHPAVKPNTADG